MKAKKLTLFSKVNMSTEGKYFTQDSFFYYFPDNFKEFRQIYGRSGYLETCAENDIPLFFTLTSINDTLFLEKVVSIAVEAIWEVDAVNYFQNYLRECVIDMIFIVYHLLMRMSNEKIINFWKFYFAAIESVESIPDKLMQVEKYDPNFFHLIEEGHELAALDVKH